MPLMHDVIYLNVDYFIYREVSMKDKTITVRIDDETNQLINDMSRTLSKTKKDILKEAVYQYRKIMLFKQVDNEYAELQSNREEWEEEQQERSEWDTTVGDGIDG